MNIGILLPYLILSLAVLDEHYAMWFVFFFLIPLLDVMFYVEPVKNVLIDSTMGWLSCILWFPFVFYSAYFTSCSWQSMVSFGILNNITLCLADEFALSTKVYHKLLEDIIYDYIGFFRVDHFISSFIRFIGFLLLMLDNNKLLWHLGSIIVGTLLNEYVNRVENWQYYFKSEPSHYGIGNYVLFRCKNAVLLPTSYMWVFIQILVDNYFSILLQEEENGLKE